MRAQRKIGITNSIFNKNNIKIVFKLIIYDKLYQIYQNALVETIIWEISNFLRIIRL